MIVLVDGQRTVSLPASDSTVIRGDGVFEAIRSYGGLLFALEDHLARLAVSAEAMDIDLPDDGRIGSWARSVAAEGGGGIVRVIVSRGDAVPGTSEEGRIVVMHHSVPYTPSVLRLRPWPAPWHPSGRPWELAGIKTTSYAPNLRASRLAAVDGFDDALLTGIDDVVLEGPTFAVGWIVGGALRFPSLELGILDSITRRHVTTLAEADGITVESGVYPLDALADAQEVVAVSTVKEVLAVVRVGEREYRPGPVTDRLRELFRLHVTASVRTS